MRRKLIAVWVCAMMVASAFVMVADLGNNAEGKELAGEDLAYIVHDPIRINSNADFTPANGVSNGNGTYGNPWVIEGWDINGTGWGYCIYIGNTTDYFEVKNCSLHDTSGGFPWQQEQSGVMLSNVRNGTVAANYMYSNDFCGIHLVDSDHNTISGNTVNSNFWEGLFLYNSHYNLLDGNDLTFNRNGTFMMYSDHNAISNNFMASNWQNGFSTYEFNYNTVTNNNLSSNSGGGINIAVGNDNFIADNLVSSNGYNGMEIGWDSYYNSVFNNTISLNNNIGLNFYFSSNNTIYHNNIIDNTNQAYDDGANFWDGGYPTGGNYWSDYNGTDGNGDGIGDWPYFFSSAQDNYPLMEPWSPETTLTPHTPIRIDSNADFTPANGVSGGNGSQGNPWRIENWDIEGAGYGYCIYLGNTTDFFVVRDCNLHDAVGQSSWPLNTSSGLVLFNAQNGRIADNTISSNDNEIETGLVVYQNDPDWSNYFSFEDQLANGDGGNPLFTRAVNLSGASSFYVHIWGDSDCLDLDMAIFLDGSNGNPLDGITQTGEFYAFCADADADEEVLLNNPPDGTYLIRVFGFTVIGNPGHFNMKIGPDVSGIYLHSSSNNAFEENTITGSSSDAILLSESNYNTVIRNSIHDNGRMGIRVSSSFDNTIVENNIWNNAAQGVWIGGSASRNNVARNSVHDNNWGIWVEGDNNTISQNIVSSNSIGITLTSSGNKVDNNTVSGSDNTGISVSSHNNVIDNIVYSNGRGIGVVGASSLIARNSISGNYYGIHITGMSNDIMGNTVTGNTYGIYSAIDRGFFYLGYNMRRTSFGYLNDDPAQGDYGKPLRKAVAHCIDKDYIVNTLLNGAGFAADSPVSPAFPEWKNNSLPQYSFDVTEANNILNAAGYFDFDADGWRERPDGAEIGSSAGGLIEILMPTYAYDPVRAEAGDRLAEAMRSAGLYATATHMEFDDIVTRMDQRNFDMYILGWQIGSDPTDFLHAFFHSSNVDIGQNYPGYRNSSFDALIDNARATSDMNEKYQDVKDCQAAIAYDLPYDALYFRGPTDNSIFENDVTSNENGIYLLGVDNHTVYHNNIIGNTVQAYDSGANQWDLGYPALTYVVGENMALLPTDIANVSLDLEVGQDLIWGQTSPEDFVQMLAGANYTYHLNASNLQMFDVWINGQADTVDLDLAIFLDGNNGQPLDGVLQWQEIVTADNMDFAIYNSSHSQGYYCECADEDANEGIRIFHPPDGLYFIKVLGFNVPGTPGHFDVRTTTQDIEVGILAHGNIEVGSEELTLNELNRLVAYRRNSTDQNPVYICDGEELVPWGFYLPILPTYGPITLSCYDEMFTLGDETDDIWESFDSMGFVEGVDYSIDYGTGYVEIMAFDGFVGEYIFANYSYIQSFALTSPTDYALDTASGLVTFASPLSEILYTVTADYEYTSDGGGNYWSDYTGLDYSSGPLQNMPGPDGIGDTPRVIDTDSQDQYPLFRPFGLNVSGAYVYATKIVNATAILPGEELTYTIYFNNVGDAPADWVWINDTLPWGTTFLYANCSQPCNFWMDNQTLHFDIWDIEVGAHTITIVVDTYDWLGDGTALTNWAVCDYSPNGTQTQDGATTIIEMPAPPYYSIPWFDDMESGQGDWATWSASNGTYWELGNPWGWGPGNASSGSDCWGTNIYWDYQDNAYTILTSPGFESDSYDMFSFQMWFQSEWWSDAGWVEISSDGFDWARIEPAAGPAYSNTSWGRGYTGYLSGGNGTGWQYAEFDISFVPAGPLWVRFVFMTDWSVTNPGWYIDDFYIGAPPDYQVQLTPDTQASTGTNGEIVSYWLTVENTGLQDDLYNLLAWNYFWETRIYNENGSYEISEIFVPAGSSANILVRVWVPFGASVGEQSTAMITAWSFNGAFDTSSITTMVGSVQNLNTGIWYPTIQQAVDNANPGDSLWAKSGTYCENVNIWKPLTLIGENRDTTIIDGGGNWCTVYISSGYNGTSNGTGVVISGFTIMNGGSYGIYLEGSVQNCQIEGNIITSNSNGIRLYESNGNIVADNIFASNSGFGIWLQSSSSNTIVNNTISNSYIGISLYDSSQYNIISNNIIQYNYFGIRFEVERCNSNTITQCNILNNEGYGIFANSWGYFHILNQITYNNILSNGYYGIYMEWNTEFNYIHHNNIADHLYGNAYDAEGLNSWDDGYPSGGNYWGDYSGNDFYSGPNQNIPGFDGFGDTPYGINGGNSSVADHYPFIKTVPGCGPQPANDTAPPQHTNEYPLPGSVTDNPTPTISVWLFDNSWVNESSIKLYVNGYSVKTAKTLTSDGQNVYFIVSYTHSSGFLDGQVVTCRITARDIHGNYMEYTWQFAVDLAAPYVVSANPPDGSLDVPRETFITVQFSEPMDHASAEAAFSIWPYASGSFTWEGSNMTFHPDTRLAADTVYYMSVTWNATDVAGNHLAWDYYWSFTTVQSSIIIYHTPVTTGELGVPIAIECQVETFWGSTAMGCTLYYIDVGASTYTAMPMFLVSGDGQYGTWATTIPAQFSIGTVSYFIEAWDDTMEYATHPATDPMTRPHQISIIDTTAPEHLNEQPPDGSSLSESVVTVSIDITDLSVINTNTMELIIDGFSVDYTLTLIPNGYRVSYLQDTGFANGAVQCRIIAQDVWGNTLDWSWTFNVVVDILPPTHSNESPPISGQSFNLTPTISVDVTDFSGINATTIRLYINGFMVAYTLTPVPGGYTVAYWHGGGFSDGEDVVCRIVANDIWGNTLDFTWHFNATQATSFWTNLHLGWNLVSIPLILDNTSVGSVLSTISGQWDVVKYYDATTRTWKSYRPGGTMNTLTDIDNSMGFWICINTITTLTVYGLPPAGTEIYLHAGWNLVGYPSLNGTRTIADALFGTGYERVEGYDSVSPYLRVLNDSYVMQPGEGYWVYVPTDTMWTVSFSLPPSHDEINTDGDYSGTKGSDVAYSPQTENLAFPVPNDAIDLTSPNSYDIPSARTTSDGLSLFALAMLLAVVCLVTWRRRK